MTQIAHRPGNVPALQVNYLHGLASGHKLYPLQVRGLVVGSLPEFSTVFIFTFTDSQMIHPSQTASQLPSRTRQTTPPLRQPANYVHGFARRLTKPFPLRQPANYLHGLASQPITLTDSPDESPDDSRSPSLSDSQPITFTDSSDDPSSQTASQLPSRTRQTTPLSDSQPLQALCTHFPCIFLHRPTPSTFSFCAKTAPELPWSGFGSKGFKS